MSHSDDKLKAMQYIEDKYGIEDFKHWFSGRYHDFDEQQIKMALEAWIEAKSRTKMEMALNGGRLD
jgi:hypothetical protein